MTQLLVLAGILSGVVLDEIRNNQGVSVYLYDGKFIYGTLFTAYKNAKEKFSFLHLREFLDNVQGWDETVVRQAFLGSKDFTDFIRLLPVKMAALLLRGDWMDPVLQSLRETVGKSYVVSSPDEELSCRLQNHPVSSLAFGFPPVGDKTIFVTSGASVGHLGPICGVSHVLVGPGAKPDELEAFRTRLHADTPVKGEGVDRESCRIAHAPRIITAEEVVAAGGCKKFNL